MAQNGRLAQVPRRGRSGHADLTNDTENRVIQPTGKGLANQPPKQGLTSAAVSKAPAVSRAQPHHRRALSELENVVNIRGNKEGVPAKTGKPAGAAAPGIKRQTSLHEAGQLKAQPKPHPPRRLEGQNGAAKGLRSAAGSAANVGGDKKSTAAIPKVAPLPAKAPAPAAHATAEVEGKEDSETLVIQATVATNDLPSTASASTSVHCPSDTTDGEARSMTMTSTLTLCSEEACGSVDMMDAEETLPDIDWEDRLNPLHVTDYVEDIYAFYRRTEDQSVVKTDYMKQQSDVNEKMRAILIDWLNEVHLKFKLMPETLYLTVNLIDRYLALAPVSRRNLQLLGVTALLVAAKYEEIWAPEVRDMIYISDNAYTKEQILNMEKKMLNSLGFNLTVPTPYVFTARFLKAAGHPSSTATSSASHPQPSSGKHLENLTWYLLELCLQEYTMMRFPPSVLAASAVYTALLQRHQHQEQLQQLQQPKTAAGPSIGKWLLGACTEKSSSSGAQSSNSAQEGTEASSSPEIWSKLLERHSGYTEEQLKECVTAMIGVQQLAGSGTLNAVHKKYSGAKFDGVAKLPAAELPPSMRK